MNKAPAIETAREAAAQHLREQGYTNEAMIVSDGRGDDFAEVRIALSLLAILNAPKMPPVMRAGRRLVGEEC